MTEYYVDSTDGSDANAGTSEGSGNAWLTIDKAMNTVAAGDKVWIKTASGYAERADIDTAGTKSLPITFEGYTTTTGDNGQAVIDGSDASGYGLGAVLTGALYYIFKNITVQNSTDHGFDFGSNADYMSFFNCKTINNTIGLFADQHIVCVNCEASGNSSTGLFFDEFSTVINCKVFNNGLYGFDCNGLVSIGSVYYGIAAGKAAMRNVSQPQMIVYGNTVDGEGGATTTGYSHEFATPFGAQVIMNNCFYNLNVAVDGSVGGVDQHFTMVGYNLLNSNTTDYSTEFVNNIGGDITGAPNFVDEAGYDYTPATGSPLIDAALDVNTDVTS